MKERKRESSRNKSTKGINHSRLPGSVAGVLGWIRSLLSTRPHVPLVRSFPRNQRHVASHREGEGVLFGVRKYLRAVTEPHDRRVTRLPAHRRAPRRNDSQMEPLLDLLYVLPLILFGHGACIVSTTTVFIIVKAFACGRQPCISNFAKFFLFFFFGMKREREDIGSWWENIRGIFIFFSYILEDLKLMQLIKLFGCPNFIGGVIFLF